MFLIIAAWTAHAVFALSVRRPRSTWLGMSYRHMRLLSRLFVVLPTLVFVLIMATMAHGTESGFAHNVT